MVDLANFLWDLIYELVASVACTFERLWMRSNHLYQLRDVSRNLFSSKNRQKIKFEFKTIRMYEKIAISFQKWKLPSQIWIVLWAFWIGVPQMVFHWKIVAMPWSTQWRCHQTPEIKSKVERKRTINSTAQTYFALWVSSVCIRMFHCVWSSIHESNVMISLPIVCQFLSVQMCSCKGVYLFSERIFAINKKS